MGSVILVRFDSALKEEEKLFTQKKIEKFSNTPWYQSSVAQYCD
jgi:hypothetical protein